MVIINQACEADAAIIHSIADATWWNTYVPIIGKEQVAYMLHLFYNTAKLQQQIRDNEQTYLILYEENIPVAFASYSPRSENTDVYKLHKLYCLETTREKGYGKILVQAVINAIQEAGKHILELNVNRNNPAIGFYEKLGFTIAYDEDIAIGEGYEMNDHVMRKLL